MSKPDEERSEHAWRELCARADPRPAELLDAFGVHHGSGDSDWVARMDGTTVHFIDVHEAVGVLVSDLESGGLADRVTDWDIATEIVHHAALDTVARQTRSWAAVRARIDEVLTKSVVAVPVGGVYSSVADEDGNAMPLRLGSDVVAGHLDLGFEEAVDALAREHGLPGFRFTEKSWWTDELMAGKEDPQIGQEILEDYADGDAWPWFVIAVGMPVAGIAAEFGAIQVCEALLGALVLLDHPPGTWWNEGVPWIPGQPATAETPWRPTPVDIAKPTEPQIVDGRSELDNADTTSVIGPSPAEVDFGSHFADPARTMLEHIASSARAEATDEVLALSSACRLVREAVISSSPDGQEVLAAAAARLLIETVVHGEALADVVARGVAWRTEHDEGWPRHRWHDEPLDQESWSKELAGGDQLQERIARAGSIRRGPLEYGGHELLHVTQALFFAFAAAKES